MTVTSDSQTLRIPAPFDRLSLAGKVAVVSGSAQGIGLATASLLSQLGATVVMSDIDGDKARAAADSLAAGRSKGWGAALDICSADAVETFATQVRDRYEHLDVLVNAAAIAAVGDIMDPFVAMDRQKWMRLIDVNLVGTITMTQALLPLMVDGRGASIVNFVSDSYKGLDTNMAVYAAGKAGVAAFTKSLAREVGRTGFVSTASRRALLVRGA